MLGFADSLGQVLAAVPRWWLVGAAVLFVAAWVLRRLRREGYLTARVVLIVAGVVVVALALRQGADVAGKARRADVFRATMSREETAAVQRYQSDLSAFRNNCAPGKDATAALRAACLDLAAALIGNLSCKDECLRLLDERPDLSEGEAGEFRDASLDAQLD